MCKEFYSSWLAFETRMAHDQSYDENPNAIPLRSIMFYANSLRAEYSKRELKDGDNGNGGNILKEVRN